MPATAEEAVAIVSIINKHLSYGKAQELMKELNTRVGRRSANPSLKMTLQMLEDLYILTAEEAEAKWAGLAKLYGYTAESIGLGGN